MAAGNDVELVYGLHAIRHALRRRTAAPVQLRVQKERLGAGPVQQLLQEAAAIGLTVTPVSREELDRDSGGGRHQGVVLTLHRSPRPELNLDEVLADRAGPLLLLVLDGVQDPHNLGACVRTADAAGAGAVVIPRNRAAPLTAAARKVASGGAEHTPVIQVTNISRTLRRMKQAGVWIVGTAADAAAEIYDLDLTLPSAFVLGGEEKGLHQNVRKQCDHLVRLPMHGEVESLNVSVAAGVCLYEAVRQRRGGQPPAA